MTSRLLDARRTLIISLSVIAGMAVEVFPSIAGSAPQPLSYLVGSSLVLSTVIALTLNLLFRLGVRKTATLTIEAHDVARGGTPRRHQASELRDNSVH